MGKIIVEYGVPAIGLSLFAIFACKIWFYMFFPCDIKEARKLNEKSKAYDKKIKGEK